MSNTERPKPRPRPRPRFATSKIEDMRKDGSVDPSSSRLSESNADEDEDAMFIRNKSRTIRSWKKMNEVVEKTEAKALVSPTGDVSEEEEVEEFLGDSLTFYQRQKKKRAKPKYIVKELPFWTKEDGLAKYLGVNAKNDNADDLYTATNNTKANPTIGDVSPTEARKRARSRSRSLTPPPQVSIEQKQRARDLIDQVLYVAPPRAPSPTFTDEESDGDFVLAPELAAIASKVNDAKDTEPKDLDPSNSSIVAIKVKWMPHPADKTGKAEVWTHSMKRNESFIDLFEAVADTAGVLSRNLFVTHNNIRVFGTSTPKALSIWSEAEFVACTTNTHEFLRKNKLKHTDSHGPSVRTVTSPDAELIHGSGSESETSKVEDDQSDRIKLHIRAGNQTIIMSVKSTTKCKSIIETFLRKTGRSASASKSARLRVDGEKLDPESEIGEMDLEDGDLVDVVGI